MELYWTLRDIPHCYLSATPVHLIYRVRNCAPVKALKLVSEDLRLQMQDLVRKKISDPAALQRVLQEHLSVYDALLDAQDQSKYVLKDARAARIVIDSWLTLQARSTLVVYAICVMGNHVHVLLRGLDGQAAKRLGGVVHRHKTFTSSEIRKSLQLEAPVWGSGFFDRYARPGTFWEVLSYVLRNPQAARLVHHWTDWPNTYVDPRCLRDAERRGIEL